MYKTVNILTSLLLITNIVYAGYITPQLQAVLDTLSPSNKTSVCVHLVEKPNLARFAQREYAQKIIYLQSFAEQKQTPLINYVKSFGDSVENIQSFWVFNGFSFKGTKNSILAVAQRQIVEFVSGGEISPLKMPSGSGSALRQNEWNIDTVRANLVWNLGYHGDNIVICIFDDGMQASHESYGSWPFGKWRTDYGPAHAWKDTYDTTQTTPKDYSGHGTHVGGIAIGGDGGATMPGIGVAFGSKLIACTPGPGGNSARHSCFQWIASLAENNIHPHVVNGSWGAQDGCGESVEFWNDILTLRSFDIIPSFCIGNYGFWYDKNWPPGNYPTTIGVGATDVIDSRATFSCHGPAPDTFPWNNTNYWARSDWDLLKPDIMAPGTKHADSIGILSADKNNYDGYVYKEGTSQATPHVTGAIALMLEASIDTFAHKLDYYDIYNILLESANPVGHQLPDTLYGWGRLDCKAAVDSVLRFHLKSSSPKVLTTNNQRKIIYDPREGTTHLVYQSGKYIRYTNDSISTWKYERKVSDGEYPCIALDDSSNVHCICKDGVTIGYNRRVAGVWETSPFTIYDGGMFTMDINTPSLAVTGDTGHVAFETQNQWMTSYLRYGTYDITSNDPAIQDTILEASFFSRFGPPSISIYQDTIKIISYTKMVSGIREVYYYRTTPSGWRSYAVSTIDTIPSTNPTIITTPSKVWFFWEEGSTSDIYYRIWSSDSGWHNTPTAVDTNSQEDISPRACYHPQHTDRIYLAWSKYINGNWEIYTSAYYNGWQTPTYVSQSDSADSKDPDVTYIPSMIGGTLVTAYTEGNKRWCSRGKFLPLYTIKINKAGAGIGGPQGSETELVQPFLFEKIHPNPGKGLLKIKFNSPDERHVMVKIYDIVGRKVKTVFDSKAKFGINEFIVQPADFPAGVYFVRLEAYSYERTEKVILLK